MLSPKGEFFRLFEGSHWLECLSLPCLFKMKIYPPPHPLCNNLLVTFGINFPCFSFKFLQEARAKISNLANIPSFQDFTVDFNRGGTDKKKPTSWEHWCAAKNLSEHRVFSKKTGKIGGYESVLAPKSGLPALSLFLYSNNLLPKHR